MSDDSTSSQPYLADKLGGDGDEFYQRLMQAHEGLSSEQSHALNARLVLMLANSIGDLNHLNELLSLARSFDRTDS